MDCVDSQRIRKMLHSEGMFNMFDHYDVLELTDEEFINLSFQKVPTIMVISNNGNREMHEAENAFTWLRNIVSNRRYSMAMAANNQRLKILEKNILL